MLRRGLIRDGRVTSGYELGGALKRATTTAILAVAMLAFSGAAMAKKPVSSPVNAVLPAISGMPIEGSQLTASAGSWRNNPTSFAYRWQRCDSAGANCSAISRATSNSYTSGPADFGDTLRAVVTASNTGGSAEATSAQTAVVTAPPGTPATAYQLNAAHTGVTGDGFWAGAVKRWFVNLGGGISYPLIVGNQVFVTVADSGTYGSRLYALNANTGSVNWGPVELGGTYFWSGLTYDNGRVFTVNWSGRMEAFDANSGALQWTIQLQGNADVSSPPTAFGGLVYTAGAGVGGTVFAVDEATGAVVWTGSVMNGDNSSPAVSSSGAYVSYACGQAYDFAPSTGGLEWHRSTGCEGGGGKTPVLANGRLYVRDFSYPAILDASSGSLLGAIASSGPAPAVSSTTVYDQVGGTLSASGVTPGSPTTWSFTGDGTLSSAPLLAGADVFIAGTSGNVYALSAADGTVVWSANAGNVVSAPDEQNVSQPLTGLAVSGGLLVVPAGNTLVAFR
jgi:outer membrane protein assembly factor BamB